MTRWIVNPRTHEVRQFVEHAPSGDLLEPGEFFFDAPTASDAAMAGRRHNLAVEALESVDADEVFSAIGDRIECRHANTTRALQCLAELTNALEALGFEVWREGLALLVLARRVQGTEGIHAWVSEIGSNR